LKLFLSLCNVETHINDEQNTKTLVKRYTTPIANFTTLNDMAQPTELAVSLFEAGKHYTFSMQYLFGERVNMTVEDIATGQGCLRHRWKESCDKVITR